MGSYHFSNRVVERPQPDNLLEAYLSDIHFPHHFGPGWETTLKVIKAVKPGLIYLGGDVVDNAAVSRHAKSITNRAMFKHDLMAARRELQRLRRAAPNAQIVYREGNHDEWLAAFIEKQAPELSVLDELRLPFLLRLDDLGIEWVEAGAREKWGHLWHLHGHEVEGSSAKAKFSKLNANFIAGHHHVFDQYLRKDYEGVVRGGWLNACLYSEDHADYVHHNEWQVGFSLIHYVRGYFEVRQIPIHVQQGVAFCVVNGRAYETEA